MDACLLLLCLCQFFSTKPRDWLGRTSPKWPILCRVGCKTTIQSINQHSGSKQYGNKMIYTNKKHTIKKTKSKFKPTHKFKNCPHVCITLCRTVVHNTEQFWLFSLDAMSFPFSTLTLWWDDRQTIGPYLADKLYRVADVDLRRQLRSASMSTLIVPPMRHSTIGDCAFLATASRVLNSLPSSISLSTSLTVLRRRLKTELFLRCFGPDCAWRFSCRYSVSCLTPNTSFLL